jgi:hypothetical protein
MNREPVKGVIELQPQPFRECPYYSTLGLRTTEGELIEVFIPVREMAMNPDRFFAGRSLTLIAGEWQTEPSPDGEGLYRRLWPLAVAYDA